MQRGAIAVHVKSVANKRSFLAVKIPPTKPIPSPVVKLPVFALMSRIPQKKVAVPAVIAAQAVQKNKLKSAFNNLDDTT